MAIFGLPPVDVHGPLHYLGIMDPLCGVTRGTRLAMLGHLGQAWRYNPLSVVLVAGACAIVLRQALGLATGRWLNLQEPVPARLARHLNVAGMLARLRLGRGSQALRRASLRCPGRPPTSALSARLAS